MRLMTNWLAQLLELIESLSHLSLHTTCLSECSTAVCSSGLGTRPAQLTVRLPVHVMLGGLVSWTVMVWVQVLVLRHRRSEERRVGMECWLGQLLELIESLCQLTVTAPPKLSLVITLLVSGAG